MGKWPCFFDAVKSLIAAGLLQRYDALLSNKWNNESVIRRNPRFVSSDITQDDIFANVESGVSIFQRIHSEPLRQNGCCVGQG